MLTTNTMNLNPQYPVCYFKKYTCAIQSWNGSMTISLKLIQKHLKNSVYKTLFCHFFLISCRAEIFEHTSIVFGMTFYWIWENGLKSWRNWKRYVKNQNEWNTIVVAPKEEEEDHVKELKMSFVTTSHRSEQNFRL